MGLTVTGFCPKDAGQALRQAQWIRELGGAKGHSLLLVADTACPAFQVGEIRDEYAKSYDAVEVLPFVDHYRSWPRSCNGVFAEASRHIMRTKPQPWLNLEPDAVPLKEGWLTAIWTEYRQSGKAFSGDFVSSETAGINVVPHCSGVAVYPSDMYTHAGLALIADETAWDVAAAEQIVPQMHKSELILHRWKHGTFESWAQVQADIFDKKPKAVLFHASKDGSLIKLLREHRTPSSLLQQHEAKLTEVLQPLRIELDRKRAQDAREVYDQLSAEKATCCIFIKSWEGDCAWLHYCLRSIEKFASGFSETVLMLPIGMEFTDPLCRIVRVDEPHGEDSYLRQQNCKMHADVFTDADFILFTDSDCIFTRPITPQTYFTDGKPDWMITPYAKTDTPWRPMIEKFLGRPVEFETMRRHPTVVPRWLLAALREFCVQQHGMTLDKYVMSRPYREFSEFNALGAFGYYFHHDRFNWINTEEVPADQWPPLTVLQKYSHGGLDEATKAEFEAILSPASTSVASAPNGTAESIHGTIDGQIPWTDKEASVAEIERLSSRLKQFCTGRGRVRQVRDILRAEGVIK